MTPEQEVIFKLQLYFIENDIYKNYGKLDGVLFDLNSLRKGVRSLIDEFAPLVKGEIFEKYISDDSVRQVYISEYLKMKYDESQAMSHASGYLYNCLTGAWSDGVFWQY